MRAAAAAAVAALGQRQGLGVGPLNEIVTGRRDRGQFFVGRRVVIVLGNAGGDRSGRRRRNTGLVRLLVVHIYVINFFFLLEAADTK